MEQGFAQTLRIKRGLISGVKINDFYFVTLQILPKRTGYPIGFSVDFKLQPSAVGSALPGFVLFALTVTVTVKSTRFKAIQHRLEESCHCGLPPAVFFKDHIQTIVKCKCEIM